MKLKLRQNKIFFLIFFLIIITYHPVFAGPLKHNLVIGAKLSAGEYFKNNKAIPVTIDVTNHGANFKGRLYLTYDYSYITDTSTSKYYTEISLAPGTSKRFFLFIPKTVYLNQVINVVVEKGGDTIEKAVNLRFLNDSDFYMIALNRQRGGLAYLIGFTSLIPQGSAMQIAYPEPSTLPIHWQSYGSASCILINDYSSLNLKREQETAILNYVKTGGTLIISTNLNPSEYNGSQLLPYLPFRPEATFEPAPDLRGRVFNNKNVLLMGGEVKGDILLSYLQHPLIISGLVGEGRIIYITADLSGRPFTAKFEEKQLWKTLIKEINNLSAERKHIDLEQALTTLPELSAPPFNLIFWTLFIYIVFVGPINYYYLKKKDKLTLLFITVPLIAIAFSSIIFFMGFSIKGSDILQRAFSIVYIGNGQSCGKVDTVYSIFSPRRANYDITLENAHANGWMLTGNMYYSRPNSLVQEDEYLSFRQQTIQMWNLKQYMAEMPVDFKGSFVLNVNDYGNTFIGTVSNGTGRELKDCILIYKGSVSSTFNLKKGINNIQVRKDKRGLSSSANFAKHLTNVYVKKATDKDPFADAKKQAIAKLSDDFSTYPGRMALISWSEEKIDPVGINTIGAKRVNENLFYVR